MYGEPISACFCLQRTAPLTAVVVDCVLWFLLSLTYLSLARSPARCINAPTCKLGELEPGQVTSGFTLIVTFGCPTFFSVFFANNIYIFDLLDVYTKYLIGSIKYEVYIKYVILY